MDAKRLLAEATTETLRDDAGCARALAEDLPSELSECGGTREEVNRVVASLLRLAALADAVAALDTRTKSPPSQIRWSVQEDGELWWNFILVTKRHDARSLFAALSTLLPAPEDTTDG